MKDNTAKSVQLAASRNLSVSEGMNIRSNKVKNTSLKWDEFVERLKTPIRTHETFAEYCKASKKEKDLIKDKGYFICGHFEQGIRKKLNLKYRDAVTLDADHLDNNYELLIELALGDIEYVYYSTHSHSPRKPRLRLIIPLSRSVTPEEYTPLARKIAEFIGMDYFDDTTYEVSRAMYFPSVSKDSEYIFHHNKGTWFNPDDGLNRYDNWRNVEEWPLSSKQLEAPNKAIRKAKDKAQNPTEKTGIVGAFCRSYSITDVITQYIPDEYEIGTVKDRFTYTHGTTVNGAVLYDNHFLFSHHEKDPVSGNLVNAFDLVRIHKFGYLDEDAKEGTPNHKTPSFKAMVEFAQQDPSTKQELIKESIDDFDDIETDEDKSWLLELETNEKGSILPKLTNINHILNHDTKLKNAIAHNELIGNPVYLTELPWSNQVDNTNGVPWKGADDLMLRQYLEKKYKIEVSDARINDAVNLTAYESSFHPIKQYLNSLTWDGEPRLETMLHRIAGVESNAYTNAVSKKFMCAAVARIFNPGCKFDYILILEGAQGKRKSTFINVLAGDWFGDNVSSFKGKEAVEGMLGHWLIELGELNAFGKAEIEHIKAFISRTDDKVRLAYDRRPQNFPRQTIFIGTTNDDKYLRDDTGNRRFWPVLCEADNIDIETLIQERDQLWAEALELYKAGEKLYLDKEEANILAAKEQKERYVDDGLSGVIEQWLNQPIAKNHWDVERDTDDFFTSDETVERDRTCVTEIWLECLGGRLSDLNAQKSNQIRRAMKQIEGWENTTQTIRFGKRYGIARGFKKCHG